MTLLNAYRAERGLGFQAKWALGNARTRLAWEAAGGETVDAWEAERFDDEPSGRVRLLIKADPDPSNALDFEGTMADHKRERERAQRDGVCGIVGQVWAGGAWEDVDSVWGFIGSDWRNSGYDTDVMATALDALAARDAEAARAMEDARPDLYTLH